MDTVLIGLDDESALRLGPILDQLGLAVESFESAAAAVERMTAHRFRVVICRYPLPDLTMAELLRVIRRRGAPSRDTPLLVVTMPELREEARQQLGRGPFVVTSAREPLAVQQAALEQLLRLEPRRALNIPARFIVEGDDSWRQLEGHAVNISLSGMLVDLVPLLPVATQCRFELGVSETPLRGTAEVVRHSRPTRERVHGFAVRFLSFDAQDREVLAACLAAAG